MTDKEKEFRQFVGFYRHGSILMILGSIIVYSLDHDKLLPCFLCAVINTIVLILTFVFEYLWRKGK